MADNSSDNSRNIIIGIIVLLAILLLVFLLTSQQDEVETPSEKTPVSEQGETAEEPQDDGEQTSVDEETVSEEPVEPKDEVVEEGSKEEATPEVVVSEKEESVEESPPAEKTVSEEPVDDAEQPTGDEKTVSEEPVDDAEQPTGDEKAVSEELVEPKDEVVEGGPQEEATPEVVVSEKGESVEESPPAEETVSEEPVDDAEPTVDEKAVSEEPVEQKDEVVEEDLKEEATPEVVVSEKEESAEESPPVEETVSEEPVDDAEQPTIDEKAVSEEPVEQKDEVVEEGPQEEATPEVVAAEKEEGVEESPPVEVTVTEKPKANTVPKPGIPVEVNENHVQIIAPTFDVVRISDGGASVIAGRSSPSVPILVLADSKSIAEETTNSNGEFTAIFSLVLSTEPIEIVLAAVAPDNSLIYSKEIRVVARPVGNQEEGGSVPIEQVRIVQDDDGIRVVNTPDKEQLLEMVTYEDTGHVNLLGSGDPENKARILLDGKQVISETIDEEGKWEVELTSVEPGDYLLTIDEVSDEGNVIEKVETPLRIEPPSHALEAKEKIQENPRLANLVTVQKGFTLWGISRRNYGLGRLYVRIYNANKNQIDDPDLIYPGQIFVVPVGENEAPAPLK